MLPAFKRGTSRLTNSLCSVTAEAERTRQSSCEIALEEISRFPRFHKTAESFSAYLLKSALAPRNSALSMSQSTGLRLEFLLLLVMVLALLKVSLFFAMKTATILTEQSHLVRAAAPVAGTVLRAALVGGGAGFFAIRSVRSSRMVASAATTRAKPRSKVSLVLLEVLLAMSPASAQP